MRMTDARLDEVWNQLDDCERAMLDVYNDIGNAIDNGHGASIKDLETWLDRMSRAWPWELINLVMNELDRVRRANSQNYQELLIVAERRDRWKALAKELEREGKKIKKEKSK